MASGFNDLKELFKDQHLQSARMYLEFENYDDNFDEDVSQSVDECDLFVDIAGVISADDTVGPNVRPSLAALTDKLLNLKINDEVLKIK